MNFLKKGQIKNNNNLTQILLYILSSILSTVFDWLVFMLLLRVFNVSDSISYTAGKILSGIMNFLINNFIVFHKKADVAILKRAGEYALSVCLSLLVGNLLLWIFTQKVNLGSELSKLISDIICFFMNYFVQKYFVFRNR